MTNPLPPTDSPAGIADGEIEEFSKLLEWHKVFHEAERNDDIGAVGRRVLDAVHEGFPSLIARLKHAEAERDDWKYSAEKRGITLNTALKYIREKRAAIKQLESERDRLKEALVDIKDWIVGDYEPIEQSTMLRGIVHKSTAALADAGKKEKKQITLEELQSLRGIYGRDDGERANDDNDI